MNEKQERDKINDTEDFPDKGGRRKGAARFILPAIIILGTALRVAYVLSVHDSIVLEPRGYLDDFFYNDLAWRVFHGNYALDSHPFFLAPLYIYFSALVYMIFSPGNFPALFLFQAILQGAGIWFIFILGKELAGKRAGLIAAALFALDGLAAMYSASILPASIDPVIFAALFAALAKSVNSKSLKWWTVTGALGGLASLNRPNALLLVAFIPLLPLWWTKKRGVKPALFFIASAFVVISPAAFRNYAVSGEFVLISSHGGLNFYIGNGAQAAGTYRSPSWMRPDVEGQIAGAATYVEGELGRKVDSSETSRFLYRRTWAEIKEDVPGWLSLMLKKTLFMLSPEEAGLNMSVYYMRELSPVLWLLPVGSWFLIPAGLAGAFAGRKSKGVVAVTAAVLVYGATVVMFFVSDRYRLPLHAPLCGLAGLFVHELVSRFRSGEWKEASGPVAVLAGVVVLGLLSAPVPTGEGQARLDHSLRLISDGRVAEGIEVAKGMPSDAMNPFYWRVKLGRALALTGAHLEAAQEFEVLVEMAPGEGGLRCELGLYYQKAGLLMEAKKEAREGLSLSPEDPACLKLSESVSGL